jgi:hypothetical protein
LGTETGKKLKNLLKYFFCRLFAVFFTVVFYSKQQQIAETLMKVEQKRRETAMTLRRRGECSAEARFEINLQE